MIIYENSPENVKIIKNNDFDRLDDIIKNDSKKLADLFKTALDYKNYKIIDHLMEKKETKKELFETTGSIFRAIIKIGKVKYIKKMIENWNLNPNVNNGSILLLSISYEHKAVIDYLLTLPDIILSITNNRAIKMAYEKNDIELMLKIWKASHSVRQTLEKDFNEGYLKIKNILSIKNF